MKQPAKRRASPDHTNQSIIVRAVEESIEDLSGASQTSANSPLGPNDAKIKAYTHTVCDQIRCKKVHDGISTEIEGHINDQKEAYKAQGMEEEMATVKAIEQMGDPVAVGTALDRTHQPKPEWSMIILTSLLLCAGILLRFFTSPQSIDGIENYNRQLLFTGVGIGVMVFCYYLDFTLLGKYPRLIFFLLAGLAPLILLLSSPMHGQYTYLTYLILLFPTAFAGIVYSMRNKGYWGIVLCGFYFCIPLTIAFIASSWTGIILFSLSGLLILRTAILKNWFAVKKLYAILLIYLPAVAGSLVILVASSERIWRRVEMALDPSLDPLGAGYMGTIIRKLIEGARFTGQGALPKMSEGLSASQILPSINNDFLLTYSIHRYGWLVFIIVIALLAGFILRGLLLCAKQKSVLASLVSLAVILTIGIQTLFYVVLNLGFTLLSPFSLPFISQSSSFLLINMCLAGILLSVFKTGYFIKDETKHKKEVSNSFIKFEDGKLTIDFRAH